MDGLPESTPRIPSIRREILAWYDRHKRDLPWRRRIGDGYGQWVAEIMLQQTRVETVESYYERFLTRFPTIEALARAPHSAVLKHWEGLGYYRRALHLHQAAQLLSSQGREMPRSSVELRELPGIGEYTSAAIASIAFGEAAAAVDGNVTRVISRLFAMPDDVRKPTGRKRVAELAAAVLSRRRPGDFNQALMDLGSRICTPREPKCPECPVRRHCAALAAGRPGRYPVSGTKAAPSELELVAALFRCGERTLMRRRATGGLWSGLWEPPCAPVEERGLLGTLAELARGESIVIEAKPQPLGSVRHQLTHRSLTFQVYECEVETANLNTASVRKDRRWCSLSHLARLAISTAHRKVLTLHS